MKSKYEDIINLPHHVSKTHPRMSISARSAQFAPFAALTGYDEEIEETERITETKKEIDNELMIKLNNQLQKINKNIKSNPEISVTYFIKDERKQGGKYVQIKGKVKKIDEYKKVIVLNNKCEIPIKDVIEIKF